MDNEFRILVKGKSKKTITQISKEAGLSRNTISTLINSGEWSRDTKLSTLDKLASALGYSVKVTLVEVKE